MKQTAGDLIFIVDDDADDRQFIYDAFIQCKTKIQLKLIETGKELLANLYEEGGYYPALIILDLNMPGIMGGQALKEIRHNKNLMHIPVIVLTTSNLASDRKIVYEFGASCFLTKPGSYGELIEMANAIVRLWIY